MMPLRQPRRTRQITAAVALGGLIASTITACGDSGAESAEPTDTPTAEVSTELPEGEHADSGFTERVHYPLRGADDGDKAVPSQNWADLYLPEGDHEDDSLPLVVLVRGGAWQEGGNGAQHIRDIARTLTARGVAVYNVEYRDIDEGGGGWPETYTDVADAIDQIPDIDGRHPELDTDTATVVGHSAGAQLAAWSATRGNLDADEVAADPEFTPSRVVSLSGPLDMAWSAENGSDNITDVLHGTPDEVPERYAGIDPIDNIDQGVPVLAVHGTDDSVVDPANAERYVRAVKDAGGQASVELLEDADHVSFLRQDTPAFDHVIDLILSVATSSDDEIDTRLDGSTEAWEDTEAF